MSDVPGKIVWDREGSYADPYKVTTIITEPTGGAPENPLIILLSRGAFLHVESPAMAKTRQWMADELNAVCIESNCFMTDFLNIPSPRHNYRLPGGLKDGISGAFKNGMDLQELIAKCKKGNVHPELLCSFKQTPRGLKHVFFLQAYDILTGFVKALESLKGNGVVPERIMAAGFSHGGNMVHICNAFWPGLFGLVVDDSSIGEVDYIKPPRRVSVQINGLAVSFIWKFDSLVDDVEPDLYYPEKIYAQLNGTFPSSDMFFFSNEEDVIGAAAKKETLWGDRTGCHVFTANKENRFLEGLYNSSGHADSDRAALVKKALELQSSLKRPERAGKPERIRFKTTHFLYEVDLPFTRNEAVSIKPI
ncbi:hypothetical protein SAMN02745216_02934 [Desulfatibacillum alkenivorans DSM 16219]|jgi:hypothetical protein|uniref:Uncharacterized protein n=2 Tax=Desulfatibacillum alkenivorans TaxID=259354 RepID=A0A1M6PX45_9BACT|nr:hypothetical protein SAMN02745216_02934 [Desulfatibacillum alkenivorans DSM 16219]